ncbi:unnamed protein product [Heterobilharzia americana]|nr:unnamed protein product [Heterobilharzia americana]
MRCLIVTLQNELRWRVLHDNTLFASGVLVDYDSKTLQIMTEVDHSDPNIPTGYTCGLYLIHPELNYLLIHAKVDVSLFRPHLGLDMDAVVSMVRPQFILCRTEISNVMVSIPLLSTESGKKEEEFSPSMLKPFDRIKVRLTQVDHNFGSSVLQGEFIECLSEPPSKYSKKQRNKQVHSSDNDSLSVKSVIKTSESDVRSEVPTSADVGLSSAVLSPNSSCSPITQKSKKRKRQKVEIPSPKAFQTPEPKSTTNFNNDLSVLSKSSKSPNKILHEEDSSFSGIHDAKDNSDFDGVNPGLLSAALLKCGKKYISKHRLLSYVPIKEEPT